MSKTDIERLTDFSNKLEVTLQKIFTKAGFNSALTERAIKDYKKFRQSEQGSLTSLVGTDIIQIGAEVDKLQNISRGLELVEGFLKEYLIYLEQKKQIIETHEESNSWDKVITTVVGSICSLSQECFIDYVEETLQTKVKDGKHLQEITGIKEETLEVLEQTVIRAKNSKYFRALEKALQEGAKYKDLLQIKPQDFGLPKTWSRCLGSDQYSSILWALSFELLIHEPAFVMMLPDLRSIAQEIEAPYSVLMDCYNLTNKGKKYGATRD